MNKNIVYAGTGHRPPRLNLDYSAVSVDNLTNFAEIVLTGIPNPDRVIIGGAQGWDTALGLACIKLKIPYQVAIPFEGQEDRWPVDSKFIYSQLIKNAESTVIICDSGYSKYAFLKRDEYMVDNCTEVLALWDGSPKGGTWHTVNYANKLGKLVRNFWLEWSNYSAQTPPGLVK